MTSKAKREKKRMAAWRSDCMKVLPGFLSQLLLLLNSGTIIETAMGRILDGYARLPPARRTPFQTSLIELRDVNRRTGESLVRLFYGFSRTSGVKELSRIAGIILENRDKGTDLWEKLAAEGDMLWKERKDMALERIRVCESKMSFPLGLLLVSLLLVTAAPAMMQL